MLIRSLVARSTARLTRHVPRRGFSLIEILIVIVMISLVSLVAIPRFSAGNGRRNMESARLRVAAALTTARQAAIQKGRTVTFALKANRVTVVSGADSLLSSVPLDTLYKVYATVDNSAADFSVNFNARGFASVGTTRKIQLKRSGVANDSLMILNTGMVQR